MSGMSVTNLQAVDFALSDVIDACFQAMNPETGPEAFQRFLVKPIEERVFIVQNTTVQAALRRVAQLTDEPGKPRLDLPIVLLYREHGIAADDNQPTRVAEVIRFISEQTKISLDDAMNITAIPLTLTYSIVFLAWDRATIDAMALAWWAYVAPVGLKHSRFMVPYTIDGEKFEIGASLNSPREALTDAETIDDNVRLWGTRTMAEVKTQAVYGAKVQVPDYVKVFGTYGELFA